jgi:hypothetical protein
LVNAWREDPAGIRRGKKEEAGDRLEAELIERVYKGTEEPVVYQGEICYEKDKNGKLTSKPLTIRRKNDTLLMFTLKAIRPEKFRDNWKAEIVHSGDLEVNHRLSLRSLSDEQLEQLEAMFALDFGEGGEPDLCGRPGREAETGQE